jgi:hypothetical protein
VFYAMNNVCLSCAERSSENILKLYFLKLFYRWGTRERVPGRLHPRPTLWVPGVPGSHRAPWEAFMKHCKIRKEEALANKLI